MATRRPYCLLFDPRNFSGRAKAAIKAPDEKTLSSLRIKKTD